MQKEQFNQLLRNNFPHQTTSDQQRLLEHLAAFITQDEPRSLFVLKGYAGTGKTSLMSALVKTLTGLSIKTALLAPTGRAAKVLSVYSGRQALTIHKRIYKKNSDGDGNVRFTLAPNLQANTVFIVDEASMIGDGGGLSNSGGYNNRSLLDDLIDHVYSTENCKLIFVGDTAQLPPVGMDGSPALDLEYLKSSYHLNLESFTLKEVVRQAEDSGILFNATNLRKNLLLEDYEGAIFDLNNYSDIKRITGTELEDELNSSYSNVGPEETIVICRANKRANIFNAQIRARIRYQEDVVSSGDLMMVVKNNYHWLPKESNAGFIANGDTMEIMKVRSPHEMHGFNFADATVRLVDYPNEPTMEVKLLLDTINSESPALTQEQNKKLYESVLTDYNDIADRKLRYKKVKEDPYFNALQVKFAYAITCHKAQGGQWDHVYIDQGYITKEMVNKEFYRWLYTALTRAKQKVFLVNFNEQFF